MDEQNYTVPSNVHSRILKRKMSFNGNMTWTVLWSQQTYGI